MHIYHFPVRPFDQFAKRIEFAKQQFAHESPFENQGNFCWHKRRWVAQMELGLLRREWESLSIDQAEATQLQSRGTICCDEFVRQFFVPKEDATTSHLAVGSKSQRAKDHNMGFLSALPSGH